MQVFNWTRRSWRTTDALKFAAANGCLFLCCKEEKLEETKKLAEELWLVVDVTRADSIEEKDFWRRIVVDDANELETSLWDAIIMLQKVDWIVIEMKEQTKLKDLI